MSISWVILTRGDRPAELASAIESLRADRSPIVVVLNGESDRAELDVPGDVTVVRTEQNLGVPGGRHLGVLRTESDIVGFLDDDAIARTAMIGERVHSYLDENAHVGAVSFRIEDDQGGVARRHVPRLADRGADRGGPVATFLGGASAIRRAAYDDAGGYWAELFYAHEELDLSWRLHDAGYEVHYLPDIVVEHPHTPISRHDDGWRRTGRNRVLIARRNLPWPVALLHVSLWFVLGVVRSPDSRCRRAYVDGWMSGWADAVERRPIRWRTVLRLGRAGRFPAI